MKLFDGYKLFPRSGRILRRVGYLNNSKMLSSLELGYKDCRFDLSEYVKFINGSPDHNKKMNVYFVSFIKSTKDVHILLKWFNVEESLYIITNDNMVDICLLPINFGENKIEPYMDMENQLESIVVCGFKKEVKFKAERILFNRCDDKFESLLKFFGLKSLFEPKNI
jgi:hypothetical protein